MRGRGLVWLGVWLLWWPALLSAQMQIPSPLQSWLQWSLKDQPETVCPFSHHDFNQRQCQWPGILELEITASGLRFQQHWQLFRDGRVPLPGGEGFWPERITVTSDSGSANGLVANVNGRPELSLISGQFVVAGYIPWQSIPESILLPPSVALVELRRDGERQTINPIDADGRLWLSQRQHVNPNGADAEDKLSMRVYRHLVDDVPFLMATRVELEVAGKAREVVLGKLLFDGFVPRSLESPLPARIEADGRLRIQLRPGQWQLEFLAQQTGPVEKVYFETSEEGFWPEEEVWVFESRPALRQVRIEGADSLDPEQTSLPSSWRRWPAYHLQAGQTMNLVEIRRGDPQPSPNQLRLTRDFWLDFDGAGITVRDQMQGTMYRDWRLQVEPVMALGSVKLNGEPQVITLMDDQSGVEVRQSELLIEASGRLPLKPGTHKQRWPAVGWSHDVEYLDVTLHLPPGWRLLMASGMERSYNTWVDSWSVWDLFLVLITIAAMLRLSGWPAALVTGLALLLIYPEADFFLYLLLNIIVVMALLALLPAGKLQKLLNVYGSASVLILVVWLLGFMVGQARLGMYPQLEQSWNDMGQNAEQVTLVTDPIVQMDAAEKRAVAEPMTEAVALPRSAPVLAADSMLSGKGPAKGPAMRQMDPGQAAQTGPGLPIWRWNQTRLEWSGPVTAEERITLWLLEPMENRVLNWLRALLALLIIAVVLGLSRATGQQIGRWLRPAVASAVLLPILCLVSPVQQARADIPDKAMLEELARVQLQALNCAPHCISVLNTQINLGSKRLTLGFRLHALQAVYWTLPDSQQQWRPDSVLLDGEPYSVRRSKGSRGALEVMVPKGEHQLTVSGLVDSAAALQLGFSVTPHNISVNSPHYRVRGLQENRLVGDTLYFSPLDGDRESAAKSSQLTPEPIPPFVSVERVLRLGLNWYMETRVTRVAPKEGGISLDIPLLAGESVTSREVEVAAGKARVVLDPGVRRVVWFSALEKTSVLALSAPQGEPWVEQWQVDLSPLWNLEYEGLAPIKKPVNTQGWQPRWQPLPGESLTLKLNRPNALDGDTKTLDRLIQEWEPGLRESRSRLRLHIENSKGIEQRLELPMGSQVKSVKVDDELRAVDEQNPRLIIPVNPGAHWLEVEWRQPVGIDWISHTPVVKIEDQYVNHRLQVIVPSNRWVLFVGGPSMGPAILFWGVLVVLILVGIGLGRVRTLPLRSWHWIVLMVGLCAGRVETVIVVVLWFFLMQQRQQSWVQGLNRFQFNLLQIFIVFYSGLTLLLLVASIPQGLIGTPDMGITGNGSSQYLLNWFVDRGSEALQSGWFISLPLWCYRALMLVWSLWLVVYILRWLKWAWTAFTLGGHWRNKVIQEKPEEA